MLQKSVCTPDSLWKSLYSRDFYATQPLILWHILGAIMGGGGFRICFQRLRQGLWPGLPAPLRAAQGTFCRTLCLGPFWYSLSLFFIRHSTHNGHALFWWKKPNSNKFRSFNPCHPCPPMTKPPFSIFCFFRFFSRWSSTCSAFSVFRLLFCCFSFFLQLAQGWSACSSYSMDWNEENWDDWLCQGWVWVQPIFADTGEKCAEFWRNISSVNVQEKWPQEISRKILHIFHKGRNIVLSPRDSGSGVTQGDPENGTANREERKTTKCPGVTTLLPTSGGCRKTHFLVWTSMILQDSLKGTA